MGPGRPAESPAGWIVSPMRGPHRGGLGPGPSARGQSQVRVSECGHETGRGMPSRDWVRGAAGLWLVAVFLAGCGGGPAAIPTQPIESSQFRQTEDGVRAALVPLLTAAG